MTKRTLTTAKQHLHDTKQVLSEKGKEAEGDIFKKVKDYVANAKDNLHSYEEKAEEKIHSNPFYVCAGVFISGLILGALIKRG